MKEFNVYSISDCTAPFIIGVHTEADPQTVASTGNNDHVHWQSQKFALHTYLRRTYRTRTIKTRGLYIFTPFFTAVYIVERLVLQTIYVLDKEILQFLGLKFVVYN